MKEPLIYSLFSCITPSPMEDYICRLLVKLGYKFIREVEFEKCKNPLSGACLRFDFLLPEYNLIIEYDGEDFHASNEVKERDGIKDAFALKHGFEFVRLQGLDTVNVFIHSLLPIMPKIAANCISRRDVSKAERLIKTAQKQRKRAIKELHKKQYISKNPVNRENKYENT